MIIPVAQAGQVGLIKDLPGRSLPLAAWTELRNVQLRNGVIRTELGPSAAITPISPAPQFVFIDSFLTPENNTALVSVALFDGAPDSLVITGSVLGIIAANINRAAGFYIGTQTNYWNSVYFNGFYLLNNGVNVPQSWNPISPYTKLIDLPNWPALTGARVLRSYKNFLVGLYIYKGGNWNPRLIKWSHSADPNTLPSSWDETDASKDAGEVSLHSGASPLVDCATLGDTNIVYTESQTWAMNYIGGQDIFSFRMLFQSIGLLAQDCAKEFGAGHFAVGLDDIVVHNGATINSVATQSVRDWFYRNLDQTYYKMTRVIRRQSRKEMWICFPTSDSTLDSALIWNWQYGTWAVRDLHTETRSVTAVPARPVVLTPTLYLSRDVLYAAGSDFMAAYDESVIPSVAVTGIMERTGIIWTAPDQQDEYNYKEILAIRPIFTGAAGQVIAISVGFQEVLSDPVTWTETKNFTIGTDVEVQINAIGRYLAVRFLWTDENQATEFHGYSIDIVPVKEGL